MIGAASARALAGRSTVHVVGPIALGVALLLLAGAVAWSTGRSVGLPGTQLDARPSPEFLLTDYRGVELRLSSLRGRPVVLAFLYTSCADVCLLTTAGLAETARAVPEAAFVAVSVDPTGDDPSTVRRFLARQGVGDRLTYLTGPTPALERTWGDYFVHGDAAMHTDAIYLIDREGRQRALLRSDFDPGELTAALRSLL
jgi:protein SCO1/2